MSEQERLRNQGRLAELQVKRKELEIRISGLRDAVRAGCDEFAPVESLSTDVIAAQAIEMAQAQIEYIETSKLIDAIKRALGK